MQKRVISLVLSLLMIVGCFAPITAIADDITYDVMFVDENGDLIDSFIVPRGTSIDESLIPALPKADNGSEYIAEEGGKNHCSYSWDIDPATTPILSNTIFTRVKTTEKHDYNFASPRFTFKENDKSGLMAMYECSKCGSVGEVGVEIGEVSWSGIEIKVDGSAIGGDSIAYEGSLDIDDIKTIVNLMQKVGVPIPGWVNTVLTVADYITDAAEIIAEQTCTCKKEGHIYGENPTYTWSEDKATCVATFTCTRSDCKKSYDGHTVDKAMNVTGPTYTQATCTENGVETYTAMVMFQRASDLEWEEFNAPACTTVWKKKYGHSFSSVFNNDATCMADGTYTQTCSRCGLSYTKAVQGSKLDHHVAGRVEIENEVAATCTTPGSYDTVKYCKFCNKEFSRVTTNVDALGHNPKAAVKENIIEATCSAAGSYDSVVRCSVCNAEISRNTETDPKKDHNKIFVSENATPSTCTAGGTYDKVQKCTLCGAEFSRETITLDPSPHQYEDVTVLPTCTTEGYIKQICSVCGSQGQVTILDDLPEHEYDDTVTIPATCSRVGELTHVCSICGDTYTTDIQKLDHTWDNGAVTTQPTCTDKGVKTYTCTVCGDARTEEVPDKGGHVYETNVVPATCLTDGYTTYTCTVCDYTYNINYIDATGHIEGAPVKENVNPATCEHSGSYDLVTYCSQCGDKLNTEHCTEEKKPHNTDKVVVLPTCTENGHTKFVCKDCGYEYIASFTDPKGHTEAAPVVENIVPAKCTEKGSYDSVVYCTVCSAELSRNPESIDATGHTWDKGEITVQPTLTESGTKTFTCTVCGATRTETIPPVTTPDDEEADNANINKDIDKPKNITTISRLKAKWLLISFDAVEGAQNYRVMYRKSGEKKWHYSWTDGKTEYYLRNLQSGGLYEFMFAAYKKNANDEWERGAYSKTSYRYYYKQKIKKVKPGKNSVKVTWTKDNNSNGYELFYATKRNMKDRKRILIKNKKKVSYTIKKLKKGKTYYIRVRSIKKKGGKSYTGEFSSQKKVKIK